MMEKLNGSWPPPENPVRITGVDLLMQDGPHPLYLANSAAIDENWEHEARANPHLFNGQIVLQRQLTFDNGVIRGVAHAIPYATLLWWRKRENPVGALHLFGFAVLVSSDNAIVAIRMSARTANPGQVYCAAGSLDLTDIVDGRLDLVGNMRREVREETGLDLDTAEADPFFHASHADNRVVVFRFHRFSMTAADMVARIEAHMPHDVEQEIDGAVIIRSAARDVHRYNPMMFPILDMFFDAADN